MNLLESIEYIESINNNGCTDILENMKLLLNRLCNPQDNLRFVHIAGTNGKGTVTTCVSHILKENGYKVGINISPYVVNFRERIQINGEYIDEESLIKLVEQVKVILKEFNDNDIYLPQFSVIVAISLKYFSDEKCDIVCLETGIGGLLDSTNIVTNVLCSVITSISIDHQKMLGDNIVDITFQKAGIIKPNTNVVLYKPDEIAVLNIIKKVCKDKKSKLTVVDFSSLRYLQTTIDNNIFIYNGDTFRLKYLGKIMPKNIVVSIETLKVISKKDFNIDFKNIYKHIYNIKLDGRMEPLYIGDSAVIMDGCHNIDGISSMCEYIDDIKYNINEPTAVVSISRDKDVSSMIKRLLQTFNKVYITTFNDPRSITIDDINSLIDEFGDEDITYINNNDIPYSCIKELNKMSDCFVFCGSFYFIGEAKEKIKK